MRSSTQQQLFDYMNDRYDYIGKLDFLKEARQLHLDLTPREMLHVWYDLYEQDVPK